MIKKHFYLIAALVVFAASAFTAFQSMDWKIADTYSVKFDGGDPSGEFKGLKGTISFDPANLKDSKFAVSIDVATINTGNGMKNTHAVSEKWLDAQKYPLISFTSNEITKTSSGFEAKGTLDMHGVQKEISLPFTFENNVFKGGFSVNRMDYNINTAEPNHGSQVMKVDIEVPVSK
jgi:polyisoprenoid-binding protein YceI